MLPSWLEALRKVYGGRIENDQLVVRLCPFCGNNRWNFEVHFKKMVYNCWVCGKGGRVGSLLRQNEIPYDPAELRVQAIRKELKELILPVTESLYSGSQAGKMAVRFLYGRKVKPQTVQDWNMRMATGADKDKFGFDWFGYVIVPLYGLKGIELFCSVQAIKQKHYKLPAVSKDVFVPMRRGSDSIIIVEGLFDGTSAWQATSYDVMMLLGTSLLDYQCEMLCACNYKAIYFCLDPDAIKKSLRQAWDLYKRGQSVYIVKLPNDADPNDCEEYLADYVQSAELIQQNSIISMRQELVHGTL